jgi:hypothetical protein
MRRRRPAPAPARGKRRFGSFVEELASALKQGYPRWKGAVRWLCGKTIQCRLKREGTLEIGFDTTTMRISPKLKTRTPDLMFATDRHTLLEMIDGGCTPGNAVLEGTLQVAGTASNLVESQEVFTKVIASLGRSPALKRLYAEFRTTRIPPPRRGLSVDIGTGVHRKTTRRKLNGSRGRDAQQVRANGSGRKR